MQSLSTTELAKLIAQKHECLTQLRELGARQLELIAAGELGHLIRVLSAKQRLLAMLPTLERQLYPFRAQLPEDRHWSTPAERAHCLRLANECQRLLVEVLEQEKQSEAELIRSRSEAATQLEDTHASARAQNAYGNEDMPLYSQLDLSSGH